MTPQEIKEIVEDYIGNGVDLADRSKEGVLSYGRCVYCKVCLDHVKEFYDWKDIALPIERTQETARQAAMYSFDTHWPRQSFRDMHAYVDKIVSVIVNDERTKKLEAWIQENQLLMSPAQYFELKMELFNRQSRHPIITEISELPEYKFNQLVERVQPMLKMMK